jgi:hypothetical protein
MVARARARVTINAQALRQIRTGRTGPVYQEIEKQTRRVQNRAKRLVKVDEGHLRNSVDRSVGVFGSRVIGRVGTGVIYGLYLHEGTGIYGPRGAPIRPVRRRFLRFEVKSGTLAVGGRPVVFARSVKGVKGDKWLVRALRVVPYPITPGS